jgi:hypothetical protein
MSEKDPADLVKEPGEWLMLSRERSTCGASLCCCCCCCCCWAAAASAPLLL